MKVKEIVLAAADRKRGEFLAYSYLLFYYVRPQEYIPYLKQGSPVRCADNAIHLMGVNTYTWILL